MFNKYKETKWLIIIIFLIVQPLLSILQNYLFLRNEYCLNIYRAIAQATSGLILPTLVFYLLSIIIIVVILFMLFGKLKLKDLGVESDKVKQAFFITIILWITINCVCAISSLLVDGGINWHSSWAEKGILVVIGIFFGQIFGNAFYEEIAFRGFLLPQFYLKFGGTGEGNTKQKLLVALIVSQLYFALIHIPHRLVNNVSGPTLMIDLFMTFLMGIIFAVYFLRTKNLLLVVGIHSILNYPTALVASPIDDQIIPGILIILLLIFWPKIVNSIKFLDPGQKY
jgi:CAAX protease family protein